MIKDSIVISEARKLERTAQLVGALFRSKRFDYFVSKYANCPNADSCKAKVR